MNFAIRKAVLTTAGSASATRAMFGLPVVPKLLDKAELPRRAPVPLVRLPRSEIRIHTPQNPVQGVILARRIRNLRVAPEREIPLPYSFFQTPQDDGFSLLATVPGDINAVGGFATVKYDLTWELEFHEFADKHHDPPYSFVIYIPAVVTSPRLDGKLSNEAFRIAIASWVQMMLVRFDQTSAEAGVRSSVRPILSFDPGSFENDAAAEALFETIQQGCDRIRDDLRCLHVHPFILDAEL